MPEENEVLEINEETRLDDVVALEPDDLNDDHREYLQEHKGQLTDDQKERFKISDEDDEGDEGDELVLEDVVKVDPEELTDEQKTFLEEKKADLTDEQAEEFGIEKEEKKTSKKIGVKKKTSKKGEGDEDDEDDEEKKVAIDKINKIAAKQQALEDQQAIDSLITETPELKKYRTEALKYMKHPSYSNIPAHRVLNMLSAKDQQKIGARAEREAAKKARDSKGGGGTSHRKSNMGAKDYSKMSTEDMEKEIAEAKGQR